MEFDKSRVYTALNADELRAGDKVIVGDVLANIKENVKQGKFIRPLYRVEDECNSCRFVIKDDDYDLNGETINFALAYLVERKENCTNCGNRGNSYCSCFTRDKSDDELSRAVCGNYIRLSEPKTEKKAEHKCCANCGLATFDKHGGTHCEVLTECGETRKTHIYDYATDIECCSKWQPKTTEKHYRPFKDTDELIKVWDAKIGTPNWGTDGDLTMPHIWVRDPKRPKCTYLLNGLMGNEVHWGSYIFNMQELFDNFEFLDGSPCGVEE